MLKPPCVSCCCSCSALWPSRDKPGGRPAHLPVGPVRRRDLLPMWSPFSQAAALPGRRGLLAWMFLWGATRADRLFPEMACLFIYAAVILFGSGAAREDNRAFALSVITLLSVYALCSIFLMRRSVRSGRGLTGFALLNGAAFAAAVWRLTTETGAGTAWLAPLVLLAVGAAATVALRRHHALIGLSGLYLCQALLAVMALFLAYLPSGPALLLWRDSVSCRPSLAERLRVGLPGNGIRVHPGGTHRPFVLELPSPHAAGPIPVSTHWFYCLARQVYLPCSAHALPLVLPGRTAQ